MMRIILGTFYGSNYSEGYFYLAPESGDTMTLNLTDDESEELRAVARAIANRRLPAFAAKVAEGFPALAAPVSEDDACTEAEFTEVEDLPL